MARWAEVCKEVPEFAARVQAAFRRNRHMTLATVRRDGAPRISGTEIRFDDGEVLVGMMLRSHKALDLLRDPRIAIHGPTADPPEEAKEWIGEAKLAGRAVEVPGDEPEPGAHSFRIDVDEVVLTHLNDAGDRLVIESWHPGRGIEVVERE
jgi:pyridoxamine 5'-phosphate oxidase-like protein